MAVFRNASTIRKAIDYGVCREMLSKSIHGSRITYWNVALLLPNVLLLIFLSYRLGMFHRLFQKRHFPVMKVLLVLVFLVTVVGIIRGFVATIIKSYQPDHLANQVLWLLLRFLLLAVEISVIGFGLFGYGSSSGVGKRVLSLSFFLALVYTTIQTSLEFFTPHHTKVFKNKYMMFRHGGMLFWFVSSSLFFLIYGSIVILPTTKCLCGRGFLSIPSNRTFYRYAGLLCLVNLLQSIGSMLVYSRKPAGLCILNASVLVYYSLFAPLVYFTFLRKGFSYLNNPPNSYYNCGPIQDSSSDENYEIVVV